jgi:hypothetical protein
MVRIERMSEPHADGGRRDVPGGIGAPFHLRSVYEGLPKLVW